MELTTTVELKSDPDQLTLIQFLLEELATTFLGLPNTPVNELEMKGNFEEFSVLLEAFKDDFGVRTQYFQELEKKIESKSEREVIYHSLSSDQGFANELKNNMVESKQRVKMVEGITESIFKITSMRRLLGKIEHAGARKVIGQALTNASVLVDRVRDLRPDLEEILKDLREKGLNEKLQVPDFPDIKLPEKKSADEIEALRDALADNLRPSGYTKRSSPSVGRKPPAPAIERKTFPQISREPTRGFTPPEAKGQQAQWPQSPPPSASARPSPSPSVSSARERPEKPSLPTKEFKRVRAALNRWSKWYALAPSQLGNAVGILAADKESPVRVSIEALWGVRRRGGKAPSPQENKDQRETTSSLWDLPARPPKEYKEGKENLQIPGEASGSGPDSGEKASQTFSTACETQYKCTKLSELDYQGELPTELLSLAEGQSVRESFSALKAHMVEPDLEKTCVDKIAMQVSSYFTQESIEPFFDGPESVEPGLPGDQQEVRLIRTRVEFYKIPVLRMNCGFRRSTHQQSMAQFNVWLFGNQQKLHFSKLPKVWTFKATGWVAGLAAAAASVGFVVGKLVQMAL